MAKNRAGMANILDSSGQADTYRIFDACIRSDIPLPELPRCREVEPQIAVKYGQIDVNGFVTRHEWRRDDGPLVCRSASRDSEYLLSFPNLASFLIGPGGQVSCLPATGVSEQVVRQLLLNQVIPRCLAHSGELLLHASAATLPNGKTVAFLGESGFGKSTIVSYCYQHGAGIIDDDCILVRFGAGRISVMGGVPTLRLYPDSLRALKQDSAGFVPYMEHSDKRQMCLPVDTSVGSQWHSLDALFLLCAPNNDEQGTGGIRIEPATGQRAMMAVLSSVFSLDPSDPDIMTRTFTHAGQTLNQCEELDVYSLAYPRRYDELEPLLQALLDLWPA